MGNVARLKYEISKGTPVIAFLKVYEHKDFLHYSPIVGYDEESLYFAESLAEVVNTDHENYNRVTTIADFRKLWNTSSLRLPFYRYTYITVRKTLKKV